MAVVDTLITEYKLNASGYKSGADDVTSATGRMSSAVSSGMTAIKAFAAAVTAVSGALVALGVASSKKAAEFDGLIRALEAVQGSAEKAKDTMKELLDIARAPGIGPEESIRGFLQLRRAGIDEGTAYRALRGMANAVAIGGGGRDELSRAMLALSQIANTRFMQGDEARQLTETGIPAMMILKDRFGVNGSDDLMKMGVTSQMVIEALLEGLEKLPHATDSAKNSLENLQIALDMAMVGIGTGLNDAFMPYVKELTEGIDKFNADGGFESFGSALADIVQTAFPELFETSSGLSDAFVEIGVIILDVAEALRNFKLNLPELGKMWKDSMKLNPLTAPIGFGLDAIPGFASMDGVQSAGQNLRDEQAKKAELAEKLRRDRKAKEDADKASQEEQKTKETAEANSKANGYLMQIADNTKQLLELSKITIGGSAYADGALSPVNFSGGPFREAVRGEVITLFSGIAAGAFGRMSRRR